MIQIYFSVFLDEPLFFCTITERKNVRLLAILNIVRRTWLWNGLKN